MMNEMSFYEILHIFFDFQLERDRPTDWPTDRPTNQPTNIQSLDVEAPGRSLKNKLELSWAKLSHNWGWGSVTPPDY